VTPDEKLKSTWSSIFSRKGGPGETTRLWDDWDERAREAALSKIAVATDELPVVLGQPMAGGVTLLTTRQLMCDSGTVPVQEIVSIQPVDFAKKRKDQLGELDVGLSSGKSLRVAIEPGPPYFALWNVLLNIAGRNAHRPSAS
jgi:hypothetical protein